ncbi:hypothetical protein HYT25_02290 [Candidatus Pacearchaeota archaeon]|nr:hypothetical protein [Candidatus Pacearchaeota archaeon]
MKFNLLLLLTGAFTLGTLVGASALVNIFYFNSTDKNFLDRLYFGREYICAINSEPTAEEITKSIRLLESAWEKHYRDYKPDLFGNLFSTGLNTRVDLTCRKIEDAEQKETTY